MVSGPRVVISNHRGTENLLATIDKITDATARPRHTVRGALSGALKKKLRFNVKSEKVKSRGRVYRIVEPA